MAWPDTRTLIESFESRKWLDTDPNALIAKYKQWQKQIEINNPYKHTPNARHWLITNERYKELEKMINDVKARYSGIQERMFRYE